MVFLVVFPRPDADHRLRMQWAGEPLIVQALVTEAVIERLDVGVLVWLAWINQPQRNAVAVGPDQHGLAGEWAAAGFVDTTLS